MGTTSSTTKNLESQLGEEVSDKERYFGFVNKNNICYANSITQCLYNSKSFKNYIVSINQSFVIYLYKIYVLVKRRQYHAMGFK